MADMIDKLTPEQEKYLPVFREKMFQIGVDTGPTDKATVMQVVNKFYEKLDKKTPKYVFLKSPLECNIAITILKEYENSKFAKEVLADKQEDITQKVLTKITNKMAQMRKDENWVYQHTSFWGQQDIYWIGFYKFCEYIGCQYKKEDSALLEDWFQLSKSCMWWYAYSNVCLISDKPAEINWNEEKTRLHSYNRPAVLFKDDWAIYCIDGIRVEPRIVTNPGSVTTDEIEKETNVELRRIKTQIYDNHRGVGSYIKDSGAKLIHEDNTGRLYKKEVPNDEDIVMVRVLNSTIDLAGNQKEFWLRVPPTITTARAAVAWTFNREPKNYNPVIET